MKETMSSKSHRVGASPGTLMIPANSPPPEIDVTIYDSNVIHVQKIERVDQLPGVLKPDCVNWINIAGFGDEATIKAVGEMFSIHPLALEDIVHVTQRPKVETYEDQLFVVVKMVSVDSRHKIDIEQVSLIIGKNFVLTFQEKSDDVLDPVRGRLQNGVTRMIRSKGADYLAYAIIDTIIDAYFPVMEFIGDCLEPIDYQAIHRPTPKLLRRLNEMKKQLLRLRRATWSQRDAVSSLLRDEHPLISDDVRIYLRDTYDHCIQSAEMSELYREMLSELMNTYLSSMANRTNEVMKVLTIVSTIFIPLTFLAGIYGMNFVYMPELNYRWSYPMLLLVMLASAGIMFGYFWRKGWIGNGKGEGH